jgi:hypothetical protein
MRLLADYLIDSDLCLPQCAPEMTIEGPAGAYRLILENGGNSPGTGEGTLKGRLIFEHGDVDSSREVADEILVRILNSLSFSTGRQFSYKELKLIIDWSPGVKIRRGSVFSEVPYWQRAEPTLEPQFARTVEHFLHSHHTDTVQRALRWYRLGLSVQGVEDQFSYFWFTVEIASEHLKDNVKVPSACPHCSAPLYCEQCEKHPVHKKYPGQAIKALVCEALGTDGEEAFKALQKIRNALAHGDRINSVLHDIPFDQTTALNLVSHVARQGLLAMADMAADPVKPSDLLMGLLDDITRGKLVGTAALEAGLLPGADIFDPQPKDLPSFNVSITQPPFDESLPGTAGG